MVLSLWVYKKLSSLRNVVIAVNILAKESNFFESLISEMSDLIFNASSRSTSFSAPGERHNAKTTHVVATPHNREPGIQL